jgi:hypothetical protein
MILNLKSWKKSNNFNLQKIIWKNSLFKIRQYIFFVINRWIVSQYKDKILLKLYKNWYKNKEILI